MQSKFYTLFDAVHNDIDSNFIFTRSEAFSTQYKAILYVYELSAKYATVRTSFRELNAHRRLALVHYQLSSTLPNVRLPEKDQRLVLAASRRALWSVEVKDIHVRAKDILQLLAVAHDGGSCVLPEGEEDDRHRAYRQMLNDGLDMFLEDAVDLVLRCVSPTIDSREI